jgi:hypothetical protein
MEATVDAFLTVGFFAFLGPAGDQLKGEFIVTATVDAVTFARFAGGSRRPRPQLLSFRSG